jgi:FMN phosphatase YigB (HAD superfamily)
MNNIAVSCDLDDTLAPDQVHYEEAKHKLADLIQNNGCNMSKDEIINYLDNIDSKNYEKMGVTKYRFARSCHQTTVELVGSDIAEDAWRIGRDVFKSKEEYGKIGTFEGFKDLVDVINQSSYSVVVTAGVEEIQKKKIKAIEIQKHFDDIEIVTSGSKSDFLNNLNDEFETVVHIGNSVRSDIKPAQRVGVNAIHVDTKDWLADNDNNEPNTWSVKCLSRCADVLRTEFLGS